MNRSACYLLKASLLLLSTTPARAGARPELVITHVHVLRMTADGVDLPDADVVVANGRIASISRSGSTPPPRGRRRVDGRGRWLMPGLVDMHVHIENARMRRLDLGDPELPAGSVASADVLLPYVANGVLQVADLSSTPQTIAQRDEVDRGAVLGPHIALGAMIDGDPPFLPRGETRVASTPEAGRQAVRDIKDEGYDFIKVYSRLDLGTFSAIIDEARRQGMKVDGHIPGRGLGMADRFLQTGFGMVAHAEEYAFQSANRSDADVAHFAAIARQNGIWLTTTLSVDERILAQMRDPTFLLRIPEIDYLHPITRWLRFAHSSYVAESSPAAIADVAGVVDFNRRLLRAFIAAGVPIVSGSDTTIAGGVPGFALHDELEAMAAAGMPNRAVLESATRLPMEWLGVSGDRGTVEVGRRADLLLLDADPLLNVANSRRIAAVVLGVRFLSARDLQSRMASLLRRNRNHPFVGGRSGGHTP